VRLVLGQLRAAPWVVLIIGPKIKLKEVFILKMLR
jgi:hypothetical protein